jgi:hypothetical protein
VRGVVHVTKNNLCMCNIYMPLKAPLLINVIWHEQFIIA